MTKRGTEPPADIVVLTALEVEFEAVVARLENPRTWTHPAGTVFDIGRLNGTGHQVAVAVIGEGNTTAAVITERAIATFDPDAVVFVGVAGALKDDLELGDIVVGTRTYAVHGGKEDGSGFAARPRAWETDHRLEQLARRVSRMAEWRQRIRVTPHRSPTVHFGAVAAGEVVLNSRDSPLSGQLRDHYGDALAIEMESAGVARAAHLAGAVPTLTVRGISDLADGAKHAADRSGSQPRAAEHAAAFAAATMALLPGRSGRAGGHRPESTWRPLDGPVPVRWRTDLVGDSYGLRPATLELHVIPVAPVDRLETRRLAELPRELTRVGREAGLFTDAEGLEPDISTDVAVVTTKDSGWAVSGLAVVRAGQRSAWAPLPRDRMGPVLDPADLRRQVALLLGALDAVDLPWGDLVSIAVGVLPADMISEGSVADFPRSSVSFGVRSTPVIRVPADDAVPSFALADKADDVVEELVARLVAAFRAR